MYYHMQAMAFQQTPACERQCLKKESSARAMSLSDVPPDAMMQHSTEPSQEAARTVHVKHDALCARGEDKQGALCKGVIIWQKAHHRVVPWYCQDLGRYRDALQHTLHQVRSSRCCGVAATSEAMHCV